jgi:hypothetical protein
MKSYISSGRTEVKTLEAAAMDSQPPLFHDYKNASASERAIMNTTRVTNPKLAGTTAAANSSPT